MLLANRISMVCVIFDIILARVLLIGSILSYIRPIKHADTPFVSRLTNTGLAILWLDNNPGRLIAILWTISMPAMEQ